MANKNLTAAKMAKNDEFYTQSSDIEEELRHYTKHFKDKVVYCNCDDPTESNFWHYFYRSFSFLGLKKLISTHYEMDGSSSYALIYEGGHDNAENFDEGVTQVPLKGDGDFRSDECINYLKQSDIVVTNPPFSLAREYIKQLMDYKKKFLIVGNKNWITYKEVFPLLVDRQIWIGANNVKQFKQPDGSVKKFGNVGWFTNLPLQKSTDQMVIWKPFDQKEYPAYDNYAAFEVSKVSNIPKDTEITITLANSKLSLWQSIYKDDLTIITSNKKTTIVQIKRPIYSIPITFMDKYNPSSTILQHNLGKEFNIIGCGNYKGKYGSDDLGVQRIGEKWINTYRSQGGRGHYTANMHSPVYYLSDGTAKAVYFRIFIRAKKGVKF